jgi:RimJ/RimL family protein N-acetyltransferase
MHENTAILKRHRVAKAQSTDNEVIKYLNFRKPFLVKYKLIMIMQILETERLILREFTLEDAAFILELLNTPTWLQFIGDKKVLSIDDAENYLLNGSIKSYAENGFGFYAVVEKSTKKTFGMCGLIKRDTLPDIDIGFAFLPNFISKGCGYEIASATLDYALNILKINRIIAIVNPENEKSIRLIKKIGMQFEEMIKLGDGDKELMLFGIKQKVD